MSARVDPAMIRCLSVLSVVAFVWSLAGTASASVGDVSVAVRVLSCTTKNEMPDLWLWPLKRGRAPTIAPYWTRRGGVWNGDISVPEGHYILHGSTKSCSGHSTQFVAIPGGTRHVTIALNERGFVMTIDEDMYAGALYGRLPTGDARAEVWNIDSPLEPIVVPVGFDGDTFQAGHLRPGKYAVVIRVGGMSASRLIGIGRYADAVDASMSLETAERIVALEAAGSGDVHHPYDGPYGYYSTYELGVGEIDGWTAPVPASLNRNGIQLSSDSVRAIEFVRRSIEIDASLPTAFRDLSAWAVEVEGNSPKYMTVTLRPVDAAAWKASGTNGQFCLDGAANNYDVDVTTGKVDQRERCYR